MTEMLVLRLYIITIMCYIIIFRMRCMFFDGRVLGPWGTVVYKTCMVGVRMIIIKICVRKWEWPVTAVFCLNGVAVDAPMLCRVADPHYVGIITPLPRSVLVPLRHCRPRIVSGLSTNKRLRSGDKLLGCFVVSASGVTNHHYVVVDADKFLKKMLFVAVSWVADHKLRSGLYYILYHQSCLSILAPLTQHIFFFVSFLRKDTARRVRHQRLLYRTTSVCIDVPSSSPPPAICFLVSSS